MTQPKVSVVITVYNLESCILDCMRSVQKQTYQDFEVILVDDGSRDSSVSVIRDFIRENGLQGWTLIPKENGGASSSRNAGIDAAAGEFITFMDGDDWFEPDCLEKMVALAEEDQADLVVVSHQVYDLSQQKITRKLCRPDNRGSLPEDLNILTSFDYCWGKLFRREIFVKHRIRFDERIQICEDNAFHFDYNVYVKNFCQTSYIGYTHLVKRDGSLTSDVHMPSVRYFVYDHVAEFYDHRKTEATAAMKVNSSLSSVVWNAVNTEVCRHILEHRFREARRILRNDLSKAVMGSYKPCTKKEQIFFYISRFSFPCLALVTLLYYNNFDKLRKSRLITKFSKAA